MAEHKVWLTPARESCIKALVLCAMMVSIILCLFEMLSNDSLDDIDYINSSAKITSTVFCVLLLAMAVLSQPLKGNALRFSVLTLLTWVSLLLDCLCIFWEEESDEAVFFVVCRYLSYLMLSSTSLAYWVYTGKYYLKDFDARIPIIAGVVFFTLVLTNPLTNLLFTVDMDTGVYTRTNTWLIFVPSVFMAVYFFSQFHKNVANKTRRNLLYLLYLCHLGGIALQMSDPDVSLLDLSNVFQLIIVYGLFYYNRGEKMEQQSIALENAKMKPHFIFNSLGAIMNIDGNPEATKDALMTFSTYLRANIDLIGHNELIDFNRELDNTEAFVYLEQLRFKSRLVVDYDIRSRKFRLPAFSMEVLVENSIKHGILPRAGVGKVLVESFEDDRVHYVRVTDDGIGFDQNASMDPSRSHVGLSGLRIRLDKMCKGSLEIQSEPGKGTIATIRIPKASKK